MSDTLFRDLDLIEPGDLVQYHGSVTDHHGLYLAQPCRCFLCKRADYRGTDEVRYRLTDPYSDTPEEPVLYCVRTQSVTRSTANG